MKASFCPYCGDKLILKEIGDEGFVPYCPCCYKPIFNMAYTCVIVAVFNELNQVCVIKQSYGNKNFRLISGFVKMKDSLEETVIKEVNEEIGQTVVSLKYIKSFYQEKNENLMCGFMVKVNMKELKLSNEVSYAHFVDVNEALAELKDAKIAHELLNNIVRDEHD